MFRKEIRVDFLRVYSVLGLLACLIVVSVVMRFAYVVGKYHRFAENVQNGVASSSPGYVSIGELALFVSVLGYFYFFVLTALVFFIRYRFKKFLRNSSPIWHEHANVTKINFEQRPLTSPFFLFCKVTLNNMTVEDKNPYTVSGNLRDKEILLHLNHLPTSSYRVKKVEFFFTDVFEMFSARVTHIPHTLINLTVYHPKADQLVKNFLSKRVMDSIENEMSTEASEEFYSSREYHPGDEVKRIHWKNTAKTQNLMIKVPESRPIDDSDLHIILNFYLPYFKTFNQAEITGKFLDHLFGVIKSYMQAYPGRRVHILGNSLTPVRLQDTELMSEEMIALQLLHSAHVQDKVNLQKFLSQQSIKGECIAITTSADWISADEEDLSVQRYVYCISPAFHLTFTQRVKKIFTAKWYIGRMIIPIAMIQFFKQSYQRMKYNTLLQKNEARYRQETDVIIFED